MEPIYFTTPIYYVNAEPHIGHLYTTALADMLKRYSLMTGRQVRFQTGTDEHGEKIVKSAAAVGVTPQAFADRISDTFRHTWDRIQIAYDEFIRTTEPRHREYVQSVLQQVYDAGDIYFDQYTGKYCVGCERYLTETELVDGKCPDHGVAPKEVTESNYFFRMGRYQQQLIDHIHAHPGWIRPERFRNEVLSFLKNPLEDLCISRPKTRLTWGIDLPFDSKFVTYVWFDALLNYVSGLVHPTAGESLFASYWKHCNHLIAKDILKTHAIYWPTMLMSAKLPLFGQLDVHGYWLMGESKMSKSLGNVIRPDSFDRMFGIENLRYFLFKEMKFGQDAAFTYDLFIERYNSDLANGLGNLLSRNAGLVARSFGAIPPACDLTAEEQAIADKCVEISKAYRDNFENRQFSRSFEDVMALISMTDRYMTRMEPWKMAKVPEQKADLARVLRCGLEVVRICAVLLSPAMPRKCREILAYLGEQRHLEGEVPFEDLVQFGSLKDGISMEKPPAFFPRIDPATVESLTGTALPAAVSAPCSTPAKPAKPEITIDDFNRMDFRVGVVTEAHPVEGADRLLRLMVDIGDGKPRQIFAGIRSHFPDPSVLKGEQLMILANLKPRQMKFGLSEGMMLAASGDGRLSPVTFLENAKPGDTVG